MTERVVVTGLGCISPLGNDVSTTWKSILDGKSGAGLITHYDTSDYKCKIAYVDVERVHAHTRKYM